MSFASRTVTVESSMTPLPLSEMTAFYIILIKMMLALCFFLDFHHRIPRDLAVVETD
jgi:hypothetical protein